MMNLFVACCKKYINHISDEDFLKCVNQPFDEAEFIREVEKHRMELLIQKVLGEYTNLLATRAKTIAAKQLWMTSKWLAIVEKFNSAGIFHVHLKGPVLNHQLFGSECLRSSKDLDILVKPQQLRLADDCLRALNYRRLETERAFGRRIRFSKRANKKDFIYLDEHGLQIELHWKIDIVDPLLHHKNFDWSKCVKNYQLLGTQVTIFTDEIQLLYLCWHGALSIWSRMKWVMDIAIILSKTELQLDNFIQLAKSYRMEKPVAEALYLLEHYLGFESFGVDLKRIKPKRIFTPILVPQPWFNLVGHFIHLLDYPIFQRGWYMLYVALQSLAYGLKQARASGIFSPFFKAKA